MKKIYKYKSYEDIKPDTAITTGIAWIVWTALYLIKILPWINPVTATERSVAIIVFIAGCLWLQLTGRLYVVEEIEEK